MMCILIKFLINLVKKRKMQNETNISKRAVFPFWSVVLEEKQIFCRSIQILWFHKFLDFHWNLSLIFLQVARCISQLNVQMSRLSCGARSRSNSFSPSPSRSPSLNSYISTSTSPRGGPSPTNQNSNRTKPKEQQSPKKMPRKLVRSMTMPSAEHSLLPVKVLFPSSNEYEDKYPSAKVSNLTTKIKNQMLAEFQSKIASSKGEPRRNKSFPPSSAVNGRAVYSANRPSDQLKSQQKKGLDSLYKGAKPKTNLVPSSIDPAKGKTTESVPNSAQKTKMSSNAVSQTITTVLPLNSKKKSKKKQHGNKNALGSGKSEQLLLKVGTVSRVIHAMKKWPSFFLYVF